MIDTLMEILIGVGVGVLVAVPTSLLMISLLRGEPIPWRDYLAYFTGKRPQGG